jgi:nitrate/nitrite transporter NarK
MASPYRWVILAIVVVGFMQTHLHRLTFPALIPAVIADAGWSYAAAGTIQTAYFWTYAAVQVPIGLIADRWGPRRVMLLCMATLAVGTVWFATTSTYGGSVAARMLVGVGAAAVWVPGFRLVGEWFPAAERGRAAGLISAGGGIGGTLAFVVAPWLASHHGWRVAYGTLVVPAAATLALIALFVRGGPHAAASARVPAGGLRRVFGTAALWPLNLALLAGFAGYFSFLTFLPALLARGLGASGAEAGLITSLVTAGTIVSWPIGGLLSDRLGRRRPIFVASQALSVAGALAFALVVPRLGLLPIAAIALGAGFAQAGLIMPFVMVVEVFPSALAATATGVANTACFIGVMVLPIVLGRIVDLTGTFAAAFVLIAAAHGVALLVGLGLRETGPARVGAPGGMTRRPG